MRLDFFRFKYFNLKIFIKTLLKYEFNIIFIYIYLKFVKYK